MKRRLTGILLCLALLALLPLPASAHTCVDKNRDYWCDDCGLWLSHKCSDPDKDGWCNYCDCWIIHTCADSNGDHYCDQCSELMDILVHVSAESFVYPEYSVQMVLYPRNTFTTSVNVSGDPAQHSFACEADSYFQLIVSKPGHAARTFSRNTGKADIYIDAVLYPYGDVTQDGKVNVADAAMLYAHSRGINEITDEYTMECADINGDGQINIADTSKVYAHAKGTSSLW